MDVGCSEGRRRGRSSWGAVWSRTPGSLQAPPIFSLLSRGLSPLGVDGRGHPDLLLLRHLPGVPDGPGQLQQVSQQLLQVSGGGAWVPAPPGVPGQGQSLHPTCLHPTLQSIPQGCQVARGAGAAWASDRSLEDLIIEVGWETQPRAHVEGSGHRHANRPARERVTPSGPGLPALAPPHGSCGPAWVLSENSSQF